MDAREHVEWLLPHLEAGTAPPIEEMRERATPAIPVAAWHEGVARFGAQVGPLSGFAVTVRDDHYAYVTFSDRGGMVWSIDVTVDPGSGRIANTTVRQGPPIVGLEITVLETSDVGDTVRNEIHDLFDATYREADHDYLDKSLGRLASVAIGRVDGTLVGFGLGDARRLDLPRLPDQLTILGGLCCVDRAHRGRRLMGQLENAAVSAHLKTGPSGPVLQCGRMAHPISMRTFTGSASVVPKPGVTPTAWQQEIGGAIAEVYGCYGFDPETFACIGAGRPIGYPDVQIADDDPGWEVFEPVQRDRGDSLLALIWSPNPPEGW